MKTEGKREVLLLLGRDLESAWRKRNAQRENAKFKTKRRHRIRGSNRKESETPDSQWALNSASITWEGTSWNLKIVFVGEKKKNPECRHLIISTLNFHEMTTEYKTNMAVPMLEIRKISRSHARHFGISTVLKVIWKVNLRLSILWIT